MANITAPPTTFAGVRSLFYLLAPSESKFETVEEVPEYVKQAVPFFISAIILEVIVKAILRKGSTTRVNDAISSISAGIISELPRLYFGSLTLSSYIWVYEHYNLIRLPWDSSWTWIFCLCAVDLGYYWVHRLGHEVNIFWATHQVHHSSEEYNLSTALRQSVLQQCFSWAVYLPLALLAPPSIFLVHIQLNLIFQFWIHTEIIDKIGPLEYILNSPSHHRVHHSRNPQYIDKNYAGVLIIWDRIFGTFEPEDEPGVYGLTSPLATWNPLQVQFGYLINTMKRSLSYDSLYHKVATCFNGPGWQPGKPRLGNIEDIPKIDRQSFIKYNPKCSGWCQAYCLFHFAMVTVFNDGLLSNKGTLSMLEINIGLVSIILSLYSLGILLESRHYAPFVEYTRCMLYLAIDTILISPGYIVLPSVITTVLKVIFSLSSLLWIMRAIQISVKTKEH